MHDFCAEFFEFDEFIFLERSQTKSYDIDSHNNIVEASWNTVVESRIKAASLIMSEIFLIAWNLTYA